MTKLSSIKHITFILIWVINKLRNHIDTSNRNMPKSGWINRIELITTKIIILKINELSSLFLYLFKSNELTTMKLGLKNSEGWKEKSNNFIHLDAPFNSGKNKTAANDKIVEITKVKQHKIIKFFIENVVKQRITKIPDKLKIICFFKR